MKDKTRKALGDQASEIVIESFDQAPPIVAGELNDAAPLPKAYRLNLDVDGVFWGADEIHPEDVRETDVVLDHVPDNAPGKYRWDREQKNMQPLPVSQHKEAQTAPDLERAFEALCEGLAKQNIGLPPVVAEWREWYAKTIDKKKAVD